MLQFIANNFHFLQNIGLLNVPFSLGISVELPNLVLGMDIFWNYG